MARGEAVREQVGGHDEDEEDEDECETRFSLERRDELGVHWGEGRGGTLEHRRLGLGRNECDGEIGRALRRRGRDDNRRQRRLLIGRGEVCVIGKREMRCTNAQWSHT